MWATKCRPCCLKSTMPRIRRVQVEMYRTQRRFFRTSVVFSLMVLAATFQSSIALLKPITVSSKKAAQSLMATSSRPSLRNSIRSSPFENKLSPQANVDSSRLANRIKTSLSPERAKKLLQNGVSKASEGSHMDLGKMSIELPTLGSLSFSPEQAADFFERVFPMTESKLVEEENMIEPTSGDVRMFPLPKLFPTQEEVQQAILEAAVAATKTGLDLALQAGRQVFVIANSTAHYAKESFQGARESIRTQASLKTPVGKFFTAWNEGDVDEAASQFASNCTFDDTSYYATFQGRSEVKRHLLLVSDAYDVPPQYVIDDLTISKGGDKAGVKYHLEREGEVIPNTRRNAFFTMDKKVALILSCFEAVEPTKKTGAIDLAILGLASKVLDRGDEKDDTQFWESIWKSTMPKLELPEPLLAMCELLDVASKEAGKGIRTALKRATETKTDGDATTVSLAGDARTSGSSTTNSLELTTRDVFGSTCNSQHKKTSPEKYFEAWNRRDMDAAVAVFTDDCEYEDTVFPKPFSGKPALKKHLLRCAKSFPPTFQFVVDDLANGGDSIAVRWHVENKGEGLPFTRGCSLYKIDPETRKIQEGIDEVEPAVLKLGGPTLLFTSLKTKITAERERLLPLTLWAAYMYIVFFSDGILPGANALQLEQRTWEEVRDLSLNFFLVSPLLDLPFSPVVHPVLEGVFNLLLSWAALFAGFFSDERDDKPNLFPVVPTVVGMQFLTSAFYLPYLAARTTESFPESGKIFREDLGKAAQVVESRLLGPFLGTVGAGSILWGILGRHADFGDWSERVASFWGLMSVDRVGSSFLVDLTIFGLFQGWLVDDDLKRRGVDIESQEHTMLRNAAKFVPFFGLVAYMALRPQYPSREDDTA